MAWRGGGLCGCWPWLPPSPPAVTEQFLIELLGTNYISGRECVTYLIPVLFFYALTYKQWCLLSFDKKDFFFCLFFWHIQKIRKKTKKTNPIASIKWIRKIPNNTYEIYTEKNIHNSSIFNMIFCGLLTFLALLKMPWLILHSVSCRCWW